MRNQVCRNFAVAIALTWPIAQLYAQEGLPNASTTITNRAPEAASAATAVPGLVPYSATALDSKGEPLKGESSATFLIYKDQQGGEPLFSESQTIAFDEAGRYRVQLGAANPNGLPSGLFSSGEARWLEVQIAGQPTGPRALLASVPYALKAADAATLGGLPPSAFALAGSNGIAAMSAPRISPDAAATVTTTGGTADRVAKFSGANTIVNSMLYDNGSEVGIGTTSPSATLTVDGTLAVEGTSTYNDSLTLTPKDTATSSHSYNSPAIKMYASVYNSSSKAVVVPHFEWQVEPTGNDTATPNGTLNLLATSGASGIAETGLYLNTNGTIHFSKGQIFGATSSANVAFNGTSTSGNGIEGTSSSNSGVVGTSSSTIGDRAGVLGIYEDFAGVGVFGAGTALSSTGTSFRNSGDGAGVWGDSAYPASSNLSFGIMGTADDQYAGVFYNNSPNGNEALWGFNTTESENVSAALFGGIHGTCTVDTSGNLGCSGSKSAVVPVDHNTRQVALYAVESPENWFEDFGSGQLSNGEATIKLEPTFAQTVNANVDYHVFLTPNGDSKGLYISKKTPTGFEVRESGSGHSTIAFDYRIVARRKGYETIRLADKTKEREQTRSPRMVLAERAK